MVVGLFFVLLYFILDSAINNEYFKQYTENDSVAKNA